jgi:hypothetical protein
MNPLLPHCACAMVSPYMARIPRTAVSLLLFAAIGCGGGGGGGRSSSLDLTGTWAATFTSSCGPTCDWTYVYGYDCPPGTPVAVEHATITLTQNGTIIVGGIADDGGNICGFANLTGPYVMGTVSADSVVASFGAGGLGEFNLSATAGQLTGSYTPGPGAYVKWCDLQFACSGTLVAKRQ